MLVDIGVEPHEYGYVYTLYVCESPIEGITQIPLCVRDNAFEWAVLWRDLDDEWRWMFTPTLSLAERFVGKLPLDVEEYVCSITLKMS